MAKPRPTELAWEDRYGGQWYTRLWWAPIDGRLRCVGLEVRSFNLPGDPARAILDPGAPLLELTDARLRALRLGQLERETRRAEELFARRAGLADAPLWQHDGGRGRPRLSEEFLAAVLDVAEAARERGAAQVGAVAEWVQAHYRDRWGDYPPDNSTIGRWLTEARRRRAQKEGPK